MTIKFSTTVDDKGSVQVASALRDEIRDLQGKQVLVTIEEVDCGTNTLPALTINRKQTPNLRK